MTKYLTIWFMFCVFIIGCDEQKKTPPLLEDSITLPSEGAEEAGQILVLDTVRAEFEWVTPDSITLDSLYIEGLEPFKVETKWR